MNKRSWDSLSKKEQSEVFDELGDTWCGLVDKVSELSRKYNVSRIEVFEQVAAMLAAVSELGRIAEDS